MRKLNLKITMLCVTALFAVSSMVTGCSKKKDDEPTGQGAIEAAVGTYKGKISVYEQIPGDNRWEFFDAIIVVSKEGNDKLKIAAKSGEAYSGITSKTFTVEAGAFFGQAPVDVISKIGSVEGMFAYYGSNKTITVVTQKQGANEIHYSFDGTKQ
ncbi:hypothetical protein [Gynurincola endophyticus]|jgi:hypothetical protein|uniref:hypothetical protein n=1 Tax=Gynurincola endophyticus TaxID=2479004 RepID=UPI000F8F785E|nr:hypothetical protein [Gynurincola endophyticus]